MTERKFTEEEIQQKLAEYALSRNTSVRDEVVLQYSNLVESVARRFMGACEPLEDMVQEGYIGLIHSVDKYDAGKGVKFSTYATHFIIGQIKHYLRDKGKIIKEPAWLQELNQRITKSIEVLNQELGRTPTEHEIAGLMGLPEKTIREILTTREVFKVGSLDGDRDDNTGTKESEKITDDKLVVFQLPVEDKIVLEMALDKLKDVEKRVIADHYYKGLNQTEIAKRLSISCNYVSHLLRNSTKKLRKILSTEEIRDAQIQRTHATTRNNINPTLSKDSSVLDSITGLYNKKYFLERLDEEISRSCRYNSEMSVLLIELIIPDEVDKYVKMIRMDDLLYRSGQLMRENIRKMDLISRYEDSCFALILPHTGENAKVVADRLTGLVGTLSIENGKKAKLFQTNTRCGMAVYPSDSVSSRDLLKVAFDRLKESNVETVYYDMAA